MGAAEIFVGGGKPKKAPPPLRENVAKRPSHGEKGPRNEKNVAKTPPYGEKVAKKTPNIAKKKWGIFQGEGRRPILASPLPAPMFEVRS